MQELYNERKKLVREGVYLRNLAMDEKISREKCFELRKEQDKQYKKFKFLDGFIKATEKIKKGE